MCVNDVLCLGATPLFFLDYIAMGKDHRILLEQLVSGVSEMVVSSELALLGGETAIMPDLYSTGDFDMAGFSVGVAERDELVNGKLRVQPGDVLIGVPSSGFHSNGYSLVRKVVFEHAGLNVNDHVAELNRSVGNAPTHSNLCADGCGGGGSGRQRKSPWNCTYHRRRHRGQPCADLPNHTEAVVSCAEWQIPRRVFQWLQRLGNVAETCSMSSIWESG